MKVIYYHMDGCPHCVEMSKILDGSSFDVDEKIERKDIRESDKTRYKIKTFPTIIFVDESGKLLTKLEGIVDIKTLRSAYNTAKTSQTILEKFRK
jgi:glutaredoxin